MAKSTENVTAPLAQQEMTSIDEHPLVVPVAMTHHQILADQARLAGELVETRRAIFNLENDASNPRVLPQSIRQARQRVEQIQEALDELRTTLFASTDTLEAAKSSARAELRPALKQEVAQILRGVLTQAEQLLVAQQDLRALDAKTRHLGVSFALGGCVDPLLPGRVKVIRRVLARLQD
jgi:hypothetical protein